MKKALFIMLICFVIVQIAAVTIETSSGISFKGDITKVVGDRYYVKTSSGVSVIFKSEIVKATSDAGFDVTSNILSMKPNPEPDQKSMEFDKQLSTMKAITKPLWVLAISSTAYYLYCVYRTENPKYK